jgi:hypothetical protein
MCDRAAAMSRFGAVAVESTIRFRTSACKMLMI